MMSDEIDIEEHDVLENPTIRRIFPDLSVIKKEISQYEEDIGLDTVIEETNSEVITDYDAVASVDENLKSQTVVKRTLKDKQLEVHLRFKTFLDSLADDISEGNDVDFDSTFDDVTPPRPKKFALTLKNRGKKEIESSHTFDNASSDASLNNIPSSSKKIALTVNNMVKKEIKSSDTLDDISLTSTVKNVDKIEIKSHDMFDDDFSDTFEDDIPFSSKKNALTVKNMNKKEIKSNDTFDDNLSDTFDDDIPFSSKENALTVKNMNKKEIESNNTSEDDIPSSSKKNPSNVMKTYKNEIKFNETSSNDDEEIKSTDGFDDVGYFSSKKSHINVRKREEKEIKSSDGSDDVGPSGYKNIVPNVKKIGKLKEIKTKQNNIFILGSKPSLLHHEIKITDKRQLKVVLNNIGPFLKASKVYCEHCCILFPNVNTMKCHINKIHSLSDGPKKINKRKRQRFSESKFQCQICYVQLSSKGNLVRHFENVHDIPKTNQRINKIYKTKPPTSMTMKRNKTKKSLHETKTKSTGSHKCFHCQKHFESQTDLIEHLYDVLNPNHNKSSNTTNEKQAEIPDTVISQEGNDINNIKCASCTHLFLTQSELDEHNKEIHLNSKSTSNNTSDHIETNCFQETIFCQGLNESKLIENIQEPSRPDKIIDNNKSLTTETIAAVDKKCNGLEPDQHTSMDHQSDDSSHSFIASDNEKHDISENSADLCINNIQNKEAYQCFICSQYMKSWKRYSDHMVSHNIKNMSEVDRVVFDPQCKFCNVHNPYDNNPHDMRNFNRHISLAHREKLYRKINIHERGFNSILFKCVKCEVFFLTANSAKNHSEHEAIFVNWKCPECHRLFKINDKTIHLKQHVLSKNITAYALRDSALSRVLYKCLKCAVHFSEKEYFIHYTMCDLEMPNSAYCNTCDILINRNDMPSHEHEHEDKNLQLFDFTLIVSEIITNIKEPNKKEMNLQNPNIRSKLALTFCSICHCFLSDLGRLRIAHIDGRCRVSHSRMCNECGLIFTPKGYLSHKKLHDKVKNLSVQAFYFYDIKTKKQIPPPMPKYPNCNKCQVHFLNKQAVIEHVCGKQRFTTCNICKIKLTESAFKLHVNFHKYKLSSTALSVKESTSFNAENAITSTTNSNTSNSMKMLYTDKIKYKLLLYSTLKNKESLSSSTEEAVTSTTSSDCNTLKNSSPQSLNSNVREDAIVNKTLYLYTCIPCQFTVNMYDKVVQHCHDHYDNKEKISSLKDEHPNEKFNEKFVTKVKYDPFYFRFENVIWNNHIFKKLTQDQINQILENSKYKFECRLKMEEIQAGTLSLMTRTTLYKCDICQSYIEPNELYVHASTTCTIKKKHPCSICGLCFSSPSFKDNHEKSHESTGIAVASYRIILFNKPVHQPFTQIMLDSFNKFILYQCRNCEVVIDKLQREVHHCNNTKSYKICRCSTCGLLFYGQDMKSHNIKHEIIKQFQPKHMIVIMFGKAMVKRYNKLKPSFSGKIYDFTFYKCTTCGLCLISKNNIYKHDCVPKSHESQCPKCYLCFLTEDLKEHLKIHENNLQLEYDDFHSNIISFSKDIIEVPTDPLNLNENISDKDSNVKIESNNSLTQKVYKCRCGLHFLEELNASKHSLNCNPRMKISKQSCFKCDLLFTPGELFNHLLKHHSNKKLQYKYDIINVSECKEENE